MTQRFFCRGGSARKRHLETATRFSKSEPDRQRRKDQSLTALVRSINDRGPGENLRLRSELRRQLLPLEAQLTSLRSMVPDAQSPSIQTRVLVSLHTGIADWQCLESLGSALGGGF